MSPLKMQKQLWTLWNAMQDTIPNRVKSMIKQLTVMIICLPLLSEPIVVRLCTLDLNK